MVLDITTFRIDGQFEKWMYFYPPHSSPFFIRITALMLFNTLHYVIFLPLVVMAYFLLPHRYRWMMLLAASYYFYMSWKMSYIFLIVISTLIDYLCGLAMEKLPSKRRRIPWLLLSLISNFGLLFYFKYFNFVATNLNHFFVFSGSLHTIPLMQFLLPVGISFYTFQTLSYSIDVFAGRQKAERHLGYFALYVSFFPQLVAGPIERFSRLTPQLRERQVLTWGNLSNGLRLILYGLFIKMVIADNLAGLVDQIYSNPEKFSSLDLAKGLVFYSFQIYSDFYGYSVIAIGSARIMGIHLMDNFKTPYLAKNIAEFWQRWHISLSTWFRDYLYFPLGGNRVGKLRHAVNIVLVFTLSGIWHGANWTFLIWGLLFGFLYLMEDGVNGIFKLKREYKPFSPGHIALALKNFVLVTLIWVFFRSQSFPEAIELFRLLGNFSRTASATLSVAPAIWIFLLIFILTDLFCYNTSFDRRVERLPFTARWAVYFFLMFAVIVFAGVENFPFIYFQF